MAKPTTICVEDQVEYRVHKIGVPVITLFMNPPQPYELGFADLYKCPACKKVVVSAHSYSDWPFRRHHDDDFEIEMRDAIHSATLANKPIVCVYENPNQVPGKEPASRRLLGYDPDNLPEADKIK